VQITVGGVKKRRQPKVLIGGIFLSSASVPLCCVILVPSGKNELFHISVTGLW